MHPKISRLYIHNYRCFVNFELRPEGRSLLLGYNGTGKSSVFDVLAAMQDMVVWNKDATEVFPRDTLSAIASADEQRFELDVESEWGVFRYALHLAHDERRNATAIKSEQVTLDGKPLYAFADGDVQLYRDDHTPAKETFSFAPRRSFLASLEPKPTNKLVTWLKTFLGDIWILRFNPARMSGAALVDEEFLARDGGNFAVWCRNLLADEPDGVQRARETLKEVISGFESIRTQPVGRARVLVVKFSHPGGDAYELDFDALSDGQKVLIALYMVLHGASPRATVFCFDEPDNFVSIREIQPFLVALEDVGEDLGVQSFIISHSSEVIDYIGASGAILLERPHGAPTRVGTISSNTSLRLSEQMARGWHVA
ncbi:MAG TPA: AAA family ATPase [Labilithrix sp.]|nr:AAA family ATPase [Labilithrix sp.]